VASLSAVHRKHSGPLGLRLTPPRRFRRLRCCLLYTSDAADERSSV